MQQAVKINSRHSKIHPIYKKRTYRRQW